MIINAQTGTNSVSNDKSPLNIPLDHTPDEKDTSAQSKSHGVRLFNRTFQKADSSVIRKTKYRVAATIGTYKNNVDVSSLSSSLSDLDASSLSSISKLKLEYLNLEGTYFYRSVGGGLNFTGYLSDNRYSTYIHGDFRFPFSVISPKNGLGINFVLWGNVGLDYSLPYSEKINGVNEKINGFGSLRFQVGGYYFFTNTDVGIGLTFNNLVGNSNTIGATHSFSGGACYNF